MLRLSKPYPCYPRCTCMPNYATSVMVAKYDVANAPAKSQPPTVAVVAVESNTDEEYVPERVLEQRQQKNKDQCPIKWEGFGEEESTWEGESTLEHYVDVVRAWKATHSSTKRKTEGASKNVRKRAKV